MERDRFKKLFPHLAEEMENGSSRVRIGEEPENEPTENTASRRKWAGYDPCVVDFIRRCETIEQAEEVVEYMEHRGEVTAERAVKIRKQLHAEGLRSFGSKKEKGFYHRDR